MRIGIDLGGTKTEAIFLAPGGVEVERRRVATPRDYEASLETIVALVAELEATSGRRCTVGVGIPGSLSPRTGLVRNANSTWLQGRPLDRDLGGLLGRRVRVMNDANCFVLSEASDGAGAGATSVFGVILGTGVGGGLVLDGRVVGGASGIAGEWGHTPLPAPRLEELPGPRCWCGRSGCVETWLSGPGLAADHRRATGDELTAEAIAARAADGDAGCGATLERYVERLGRALAVVVNIVDPEVVVLGGGVSNVAGLPEAARAHLLPHLFTDAPAARVLRHRHGDSSGVRGAAWLWSEAEAASFG
jgi:fructokinase